MHNLFFILDKARAVRKSQARILRLLGRLPLLLCQARLRSRCTLLRLCKVQISFCFPLLLYLNYTTLMVQYQQKSSLIFVHYIIPKPLDFVPLLWYYKYNERGTPQGTKGNKNDRI